MDRKANHTTEPPSKPLGPQPVLARLRILSHEGRTLALVSLVFRKIKWVDPNNQQALEKLESGMIVQGNSRSKPSSLE
jgi:hypothetical protein